MPSYEQTVEAHHKLTFRDNVRMVTQQMTNHIRGAVTEVDGTGEAMTVADLIGKKEPQEAEDHGRTNPDVPSGRSRRWLIRPNGIETGEVITKATMFDAAMNPTSPLLRNNVAAVVRGFQDRLLGVRRTPAGQFEISGTGILGKAIEGKRPEGNTSDLPSGNFIAHNAAGSTTGLNIEKLRAAAEAMEIADFGMETESQIYCAISPKQKTDLLNIALATKTQLNQFELQQIETGKPTTLLGITWIFTNRLPKDANGYRLCPLWDKANIVAGLWQDIEGRMWNLPDSKMLPYIFVDAYVDCTRVEDDGVRVIRCEES